MAVFAQPYHDPAENKPFGWALVISIIGHLLLVGLVLFNPQWTSETTFTPSVIDVRMVDLSEIPTADASTTEGESGKVEVSTAKAPEPQEAEKAVSDTSPTPDPAPAEKKPEVSIAKRKPQKKVALKYKTMKTEQVIENTLDKLEQKVERAPPKPLAERIKQLREKVAKGEKPAESAGGPGADKSARTGGFAVGSRQEIELIDIYRNDIAFQIQKNWAYADQLGGGGKNQIASIAIKVMPDGSISDIFFLERSGNAYLDDSAYKAIVKSSPVKPHPEQLSRPYVELGLRFGPKGLQ